MTKIPTPAMIIIMLIAIAGLARCTTLLDDQCVRRPDADVCQEAP